jgi:hypothetical protein
VTTKDDEVGIASVELGNSVVAVEVAGSDETNVALGEDFAESAEVVGLRLDCELSFNTFLRVGGVGGERVKLGLLVEDFVEAGLNPKYWSVRS